MRASFSLAALLVFFERYSNHIGERNDY